jgi:hypothetical protein
VLECDRGCLRQHGPLAQVQDCQAAPLNHVHKSQVESTRFGYFLKLESCRRVFLVGHVAVEQLRNIKGSFTSFLSDSFCANCMTAEPKPGKLHDSAGGWGPAERRPTASTITTRSAERFSLSRCKPLALPVPAADRADRSVQPIGPAVAHKQHALVPCRPRIGPPFERPICFLDRWLATAWRTTHRRARFGKLAVSVRPPRQDAG